jgi:hypothetical protein
MASAPLHLALARVSLRLLRRDDFPAIALQALEAGHDSPSLRFLAGLSSAEIDEAFPLFDKAIAELGLSMPPKRAAVTLLARDVARKIVDGAVEPHAGAKDIWRLSLMQDGDRLVELDPFIYAASEWEDRPEEREFFDRAIMEQAKDLIARE